MGVLLKFLLIGFAVLYVGKEVVKWVLPKILNNFVKKMSEQQQDIQNQFEEGNDGEAVVKSKPKASEDKLKDTGEYVDFEEID